MLTSYPNAGQFNSRAVAIDTHGNPFAMNVDSGIDPTCGEIGMIDTGNGSCWLDVLNTVAASHCGSLSGSAGCAEVYVNGAVHYLPYW